MDVQRINKRRAVSETATRYHILVEMNIMR